MVVNSTAIKCVTPQLTVSGQGERATLNYTIIVDNAPGPDLNIEGLQITASPNPGNFMLLTTQYNTGSSAPIRITVSFVDFIDMLSLENPSS